MAAYQERSLPYRSTIFDENLSYSLGLFMGMRMRETMYVAELMNLNAFDQPNVELYKVKTKEILIVKRFRPVKKLKKTKMEVVAKAFKDTASAT